MEILDTARNQLITYFKFIGNDASGVKIYDPPIELRVRWDDVAEVFTTPTGQQKVSRSKVMVDRVIPIGSILIKRPLIDVPDDWDDPTIIEGSMEVQGHAEHPTIAADEFFRQAIL